MVRAQAQRNVVALFGLLHLALLLQRVGQVAVCVRKVGLQINRPAVRIDGQIDQTLLVIHASQITVHHGIVGRQV
uniref:Putative secreted peptide n=1 Tax=Anopheles braziliensis TaxID=58242 RepID=A0A2M3ZRC1_9DIPT